MNKKKEILFVMNNLNVGGAEKALVSLFQVFDYEKYNVDLLLFKKEGHFLKQIPQQVNILNVPVNYRYFDMPFSQVLIENFFGLRWNVIWQRIQFNLASKKGSNNAESEQFGWKPLSKTLKPLSKRYDVAIGFLEKSPNYFVIDHTIAAKKIGWLQNDYESLGMNLQFDLPYFSDLNMVVLNSKIAADNFQKLFPAFANKTVVIENVISSAMIKKLALEDIENFKYTQPLFCSAGRLTFQKGFDLGILAAVILRKRKINFHWLIMGVGEEYENLKIMINRYSLENYITLLGVKSNPYKYINKGLFYFHPSRFEGKSVVVDEVKTLNMPILITNYPTVKEQIQHLKTGFICDLNPESIADSLEKMLKSTKLRNDLSTNLSLKTNETEEEIEKLYQLIES